MQNLIATTFEVVHYIALQAVHYKPLQEVHLSRYNHHKCNPQDSELTMISITSEYGLYLYTGKVDLWKGIDGLCGIISEDLGHNPRKPMSVYVFSGRNPRVKKVLIRECNRYELTTIRLDEGRFLRPLTDPERVGGKICWSDFVMLTECAASTSAVGNYSGAPVLTINRG